MNVHYLIKFNIHNASLYTHMHLKKTNQDVVGEINDEMLFS